MFPRTDHRIEAILFDMNGTLRKRVPDEAWQRRSLERLLVMLGRPDAPTSFLDELARRYKSYTKWANEHAISLPEEEIWSRWIAPELLPRQVESQAAELMLVIRNCRGRAILKPDAAVVIPALSRRGYRMGVISNTTSTLDLPRFIEECGLEKYFEVVILSSVCGVRKPDPEIFWKATRQMQLKPEQCAYLGNKISTDVVGPRRAGYGMAMIVEAKPTATDILSVPIEKPDAVIHELGELLDLFPPLAGR